MLIFPVFIPQKGCPFDCIYCNQHSLEAVDEMPLALLEKQISKFCENHKYENKQIAFYGGTFTGLSLTEREKFFALTVPFLDDRTNLRISTRPDYIGEAELDWCKKHRVSTIELGIQDFDEQVLIAAGRGYDSKTAVNSCLNVKESGFELGVQLMPGLPGSSTETQKRNANLLKSIKPSFMRIYPLVLLEGTKLWEEYRLGKFKPMDLEEAVEVCADLFEIAENNSISVIKTGIPSINKSVKHAGPYHPNFGELVRGELIIRKVEEVYCPHNNIYISPKDKSVFEGNSGYNIKKLIKRLASCTIEVKVDTGLKKGEVRVA